MTTRPPWVRPHAPPPGRGSRCLLQHRHLPVLRKAAVEVLHVREVHPARHHLALVAPAVPGQGVLARLGANRGPNSTTAGQGNVAASFLGRAGSRMGEVPGGASGLSSGGDGVRLRRAGPTAGPPLASCLGRRGQPAAKGRPGWHDRLPVPPPSDHVLPGPRLGRRAPLVPRLWPGDPAMARGPQPCRRRRAKSGARATRDITPRGGAPRAQAPHGAARPAAPPTADSCTRAERSVRRTAPLSPAGGLDRPGTGEPPRRWGAVTETPRRAPAAEAAGTSSASNAGT